jgi:hypothetical protein
MKGSVSDAAFFRYYWSHPASSRYRGPNVYPTETPTRNKLSE